MTALTRSTVVFLGALSFSAALSVRPARAEELCSTPPFSSSQVNGVVTITVDWNNLVLCTKDEPTKNLGARIDRRINEGNPVNLLIKNFNFINYTISSKVDETVVETYVMLEKLWAQLLGMPLFGTPSGNRAGVIPTACKGFDACGAEWASKIATVHIILNEYLAEGVGKTGLDANAKTQITNNAQDLKAHQTEIRAMVKDIIEKQENRPSGFSQVSQFEAVFAKQEKLFEKIEAYHAGAELVANGKLIPIGKKKAGTMVSVSLTPKDQNQADGKPSTTTEYFTHAKLPVVFHVGYTHSEFQDVKFETVRSLSQTDLFSAVRQNNASLNTMAAFLSLGRSFLTDEQLGAFISIGTDFSDPGDRLYLGASLQLAKRFFLTVGKMSTTVSEGVNPVIERVGEEAQARELFTAIATHRDWSHIFYSISFRVF